MKKEHQILLELLHEYLESNPDLRFGQAIFNLQINEFKNNETQLRDIHSDSDHMILNRVKNQLKKLNFQNKE